jgi:hypothetical protein
MSERGQRRNLFVWPVALKMPSPAAGPLHQVKSEPDDGHAWMRLGHNMAGVYSAELSHDDSACADAWLSGGGDAEVKNAPPGGIHSYELHFSKRQCTLSRH